MPTKTLNRVNLIISNSKMNQSEKCNESEVKEVPGCKSGDGRESVGLVYDNS